MTATASSLPLGTRLEEFELTGVLGEGGFSVVYVALDHYLERTVAIKEYMPSSIATRLPDGTVAPKSPKHEEAFRAGLQSFVAEARLLTRFTHSALIHIHRIWEQNGTAYMAMQYCMGRTLRQISQTEPETVKNEGWLKATFAPILDALELLHSENCFHRDISPDNILVLQSGAPVLLDFGAARRIIGDMTQVLTVILKPGFAPIEQYADDKSLQQGPWTDVYGIGAVLYYLLMGKPPVASVARLVKDPMVKLADIQDIANVSRSFREAIDRALSVYPQQRIQSIADLRGALQLPTFMPEALLGGVLHPRTVPSPPRTASEPSAHSHTGTGAELADKGSDHFPADAQATSFPEPA
ncbi:MAG: serine/threonine protein kinase, partial [Gallionellaceae bacterium]|nr:serine/threonine protein kinase [Gallionellaceae bacterium]